MSLIIDALKKTQQVRLNGSDSSPISGYPSPNRTRGSSSKKQWIAVGAGLISLCILLFVFLRPVSSPLATQTNGAIVPIEKKPPVLVAEKISSEAPREVSTLPKNEEPLAADLALDPASGRTGEGQAAPQGPPKAKMALSTDPPRRIREKASSPSQSSLPRQASNEKKGGSGVKQSPPPLPPAAQKEEAPPKSIAVEHEEGKNHTLVSEVLTYFNLGVAYYNQKEFSKAIQAYQKVIELDPTYVEAYNNLGIIYQTIGDSKNASGAFQKATETNPRYEKGYNNLGLLYLLEGRYEEALEVFQKALAINPNSIESHINLGILFKRKGQWQNAIESYQKALAIDPLHRETHYNVALLYEQLENWELAISHYQRFIQLSSKSYPELVVRVQRHLNALVEANKNRRP